MNFGSGRASEVKQCYYKISTLSFLHIFLSTTGIDICRKLLHGFHFFCRDMLQLLFTVHLNELPTRYWRGPTMCDQIYIISSVSYYKTLALCTFIYCDQIYIISSVSYYKTLALCTFIYCLDSLTSIWTWAILERLIIWNGGSIYHFMSKSNLNTLGSRKISL